MNAQRTPMGMPARVEPLTRTVCMLTDPQGRTVAGPLVGKPGLDLTAFVAEFRAERYATAEAKEEDWCFISDGDFVDWLIARGVLSPMASVNLTVDIDTSGTHRYLPRHWPECPACREGRGEETMGRVLHGLNRAEWYRQCTACGHAWDHHDEPYDSKRPMLEDDGRYIAGGCVPYALSQAGGLPIAQVLERCRARGWSENGMPVPDAIVAARELGITLTRSAAWRGAGKRTLRRVLDALRTDQTYVLATKDHWLAVVRGENRDPADTSLRAEVEGCWEVTVS